MRHVRVALAAVLEMSLKTHKGRTHTGLKVRVEGLVRITTAIMVSMRIHSCGRPLNTAEPAEQLTR